MYKTSSQIASEVLTKLAKGRWRQELGIGGQAGTGLMNGPQQLSQPAQGAINYAQGAGTADPLRGGSKTLEQHMAVQQAQNPGMSRMDAMGGPAKGQLPGSAKPGMMSGLLGKLKRMPMAGKLGLGAGAAAAMYGIGRATASKPQPQPQY